MRDNDWLEKIMYALWESNFNDVPRLNKVIAKFGKRSKRTLGSIKYTGKLTKRDPDYSEYDDKRITQITITAYYKDERIPTDVVKGTIAHEMVHYAHGFNSPLQQMYAHPHKGGIMKKEMIKRDLLDLYTASEKWIKRNWIDYLKSMGVNPARRLRRRRRVYIKLF